LFPQVAQEQEAREIALKVQSHLDQELNHLGRSMDAKRTERISSLKSLKSLTLATQVAKNWQQHVVHTHAERKASFVPSGSVGQEAIEETPSVPQVHSLKKILTKQRLKALQSPSKVDVSPPEVTESAECGAQVSEARETIASPPSDASLSILVPPLTPTTPSAFSPLPLHLVVPTSESPVPSPSDGPIASVVVDPNPSRVEHSSSLRSPPATVHPFTPIQFRSFHSSPAPSSARSYLPPLKGEATASTHQPEGRHHLIQRARRHLLEDPRIEPFDPTTGPSVSTLATLHVRVRAQTDSDHNPRHFVRQPTEGSDRVVHSLTNDSPRKSLSLPLSSSPLPLPADNPPHTTDHEPMKRRQSSSFGGPHSEDITRAQRRRTNASWALVSNDRERENQTTSRVIQI
jgi:hypothetical protein